MTIVVDHEIDIDELVEPISKLDHDRIFEFIANLEKAVCNEKFLIQLRDYFIEEAEG